MNILETEGQIQLEGGHLEWVKISVPAAQSGKDVVPTHLEAKAKERLFSSVREIVRDARNVQDANRRIHDLGNQLTNAADSPPIIWSPVGTMIIKK